MSKDQNQKRVTLSDAHVKAALEQSGAKIGDTAAITDESKAKRIPHRYSIVNGYQRVDIYDDEDKG